MGLYEELLRYSEDNFYPMHMPGHKRNLKLTSMAEPYGIDITEIEGFDNLHYQEGIIKSLSERISSLFGALKSYPLVNGSTTGILAGISAATNRGDKVLLSRNSHKSVFHGIMLRSLSPVYLYPENVKGMPFFGSVLPEQVEEELSNHPDIKLVVITSPTYEGVVSDIEKIGKIVHRYGAILMVDEAHGAHFGFHKGFPQSAIKKGADIIIQSIHKTLPALTQTALLHCNKDDLDKKIRKYLEIYQTSSPSYILMSSIDQCVSLLETQTKELFEQYHTNLQNFYERTKSLSAMEIINPSLMQNMGVYDWDPSKIIILPKVNISGHQLHSIIKDNYKIVMEMEAGDYLLGMTSICDTKEGFHRLEEALMELDQEVKFDKLHSKKFEFSQIKLKQLLIPSDAMELETEIVLIGNSLGRIAATSVGIFPPGAPILLPGELITEAIIDCIAKIKKSELTITGLSGKDNDKIEVVIMQKNKLDHREER